MWFQSWNEAWRDWSSPSIHVLCADSSRGQSASGKNSLVRQQLSESVCIIPAGDWLSTAPPYWWLFRLLWLLDECRLTRHQTSRLVQRAKSPTTPSKRWAKVFTLFLKLISGKGVCFTCISTGISETEFEWANYLQSSGSHAAPASVFTCRNKVRSCLFTSLLTCLSIYHRPLYHSVRLFSHIQ